MDTNEEAYDFQQKISSWSLSFYDNEDERCYQKAKDKLGFIPLAIKLVAYAIIFLNICFRAYALYLAKNNSEFRYGTLNQEVGCFLFVIFSVAFEGILRFSGKLRHIHGFFLYTSFAISYITAGYFTQNAPQFGAA